MIVHFLRLLDAYALDEQEEAIVQYMWLLHIGQERKKRRLEEDDLNEQFAKLHIYKDAWMATERATEKEMFRMLLCATMAKLYKQHCESSVCQ